MQYHVDPTKSQMGARAAEHAARLIRQAIAQKGSATMIVATGASQFDTLEALVQARGIGWEKVRVFHLDEYVGMAITHPASFRLYLWQRFHRQLPVPPRAFYYLDGEDDPQAEVAEQSARLARHEVDVALVGVGENGHLAFNDPPADFDTDQPYLLVDLDRRCREQQLGEGWFERLEDVPTRAISMSVKQILKSRAIIVSVPDQRKAQAVRNSIQGQVSNRVPASILQTHDQCWFYLDKAAASKLS